MPQVMYESPKKASGTPRRSDWIDESDSARRSVLEGKGWRIVDAREAPQEAEPAPLAPLPEVSTGEVPAESGEAVPLGDIDGLTAAQRDALIAAGYDTPAKLDAATDADLTAVEGVGMGTVRNLRKERKGGAT